MTAPDKAINQPEPLSRLPTIATLVIASAMVMVIGLVSFQSSESRRVTARELNVSREIRNTTDTLLSQLTDAETAQRGYILTGKDTYLEPYNRAIAAIPGVIAQLQSSSATRPEQAKLVADLQPIVTAKLNELAKTIQLRQSQGEPAAVAVVDKGRGKALMDDLRSRGAAIRNEAESSASQFSAIAEKDSTRLSLVSTVGSLILLGFLGLSAVTILRSLAHREALYHRATASAEFLRVTLASIGDAVIATDIKGRITLINPVAQKLTGWSEHDALGSPISAVFCIVNETNRAPVDNPVEKAIAEGVIKGLANHTILISKGGQDIPIDDSGAPIRGPKGDIQGGVLVFRDISARRQAEQQLKESNEQLKEFVAAAAHDLRSPLNSVSTMAQLIALRLQDQIGGETGELLGYIITGTQRMLRLLEDLLAYAQASHFEPEAGNRASMERALQTALANLRTDIESTQATISSATLPDVMAHEAHLVQLFQNLIGNALKYRSDAAPRVEIACSKRGQEWVVQVCDNGIGIEPQYEEQIFRPFKRLHGEDRPGSGIGLATCQKIVSGYGGQIWVESEPGKGSAFFFSLPAVDVGATESAMHA